MLKVILFFLWCVACFIVGYNSSAMSAMLGPNSFAVGAATGVILSGVYIFLQNIVNSFKSEVDWN